MATATKAEVDPTRMAAETWQRITDWMARENIVVRVGTHGLGGHAARLLAHADRPGAHEVMLVRCGLTEREAVEVVLTTWAQVSLGGRVRCRRLPAGRTLRRHTQVVSPRFLSDKRKEAPTVRAAGARPVWKGFPAQS